ncbi:MAG: hypothetical protein CO133_02420 [Candidatus Komeilibacteria bacterium CG_4_9_14_3_um_filter_37_5]|nr:MAG: hypothetical protein CO133_02420 [Candidatus Komeilibacteria bacterium CG_4_9_14_3_um_filter_37_5]
MDDLQSENIPSLELLKKMVKKEDITVQKEIIQVLIEHYDKRVADYQSQYGYYGKRAINQVKQQGWFECLRAQKVFQLLYRILTGEDFVSFYGSIFFNQVSNLDEQALF